MIICVYQGYYCGPPSDLLLPDPVEGRQAVHVYGPAYFSYKYVVTYYKLLTTYYAFLRLGMARDG